jgi:hypothetical protein
MVRTAPRYLPLGGIPSIHSRARPVRGLMEKE